MENGWIERQDCSAVVNACGFDLQECCSTRVYAVNIWLCFLRELQITLAAEILHLPLEYILLTLSKPYMEHFRTGWVVQYKNWARTNYISSALREVVGQQVIKNFAALGSSLNHKIVCALQT